MNRGKLFKQAEPPLSYNILQQTQQKALKVAKLQTVLSKFSLILVVAVNSFAVTYVREAFAATCQWTGAANASWSNSANWSGCGGGVPGLADDVVFPLGASNTTNTNDIVGASFNSMTISATGYNLSGNPFSVAAGIIINPSSAATININNDVTLAANQSVTTSSSGLMYVYFNGTVAVNGAFTGFDVDAGTALHLVNTVSGSSAITKSSGGILYLRGNNTYSGLTQITGGTISATHSNALGTTAGATLIGSGATLAVSGGITIADNITVSGLGASGSAIQSLDISTAAIPGGISAGNNNFTGSISMPGHTRFTASDGSLNFSGNITESVPSTLYARGEIVFSGTNSITQLDLTDTTTPPSNVTIAGNQPTTSIHMLGGILNLTGYGSVGAIHTLAGLAFADIYTNGLTIGNFSTGNLQLGGSNNIWIDVNGSIGADMLDVTGTVNLAGTNSLMLNNQGGTYSLGQTFVIIQNDGVDAVSGTFAGRPQGSVISAGGVDFQISYVGGVDSNDVTLHVVAIGAYPVTAAASPLAAASVSCAPNPVPHGTNSTCTYVANPGYVFTGWTGDCSGLGSCVLTNVTSAKNVTANFASSYPITTAANPVAGGNVSCSPNPVAHGANSICTATPNTGYSFTNWSGDCTGATCNLTNVTSARSVTANFAPSYTVTPTVTGGSGSILCTPNPVNHGGTLTCVATPDPGYQFGAWGGSCAGQSGTTCVLNNVTSQPTVSASFANAPLASSTQAVPTLAGWALMLLSGLLGLGGLALTRR